MVSIFCSHSSKDADQVASLKRSLEAIGHTMYRYEDDAHPGGPVMGKIQRAIGVSISKREKCTLSKTEGLAASLNCLPKWIEERG